MIHFFLEKFYIFVSYEIDVRNEKNETRKPLSLENIPIKV